MEYIQLISDSLFDSSDLEQFKKDVEEYFTYNGVKPLVEIIDDKYYRVIIDTPKLERVEKVYDEAVAFAQSGRYEQARGLFKEVTEEFPFHSEAFRQLAQVNMMLGEDDLAIDNCIDALKIDPKNVWALVLMGNLHKNKQDLETADKYFRKALEVEPENGYAVNNLAANCLARNEFEDAIGFFKIALEIDKTYMNSYYGMALAYQNLGKKKKAFKVCLDGVKSSKDRPENPAVREALLKLMLQSSNQIVDEDDLMNIVILKTEELQDKSRYPIKLFKDEKLNVAAKLEYAPYRKRDEHRIYFRDSRFTGHLVLHELMHLKFMIDDEKENKVRLISSTEAHYARFKKNQTAFLDNIAKRIGGAKANDYLRQVYDGLMLFVMNCPLDLFVEDEIYKIEDLRPMQLQNLFKMEQEQIQSVIRSQRESVVPQFVLDISMTLMLVGSMHFTKLYGINIQNEYHPTKAIYDRARDLYEKYEAYVDNFKVGDEYELLEDFIESLNFEDYISVQHFNTNYSDGYEDEVDEVKPSIDDVDFDIYNDEEKERERKFQEQHAQSDPVRDMMMSMYMLGALEYFDHLPMPTVKKIAFEIAMLGMSGIDPARKSGYHVNSIEGSDFGGYQLMAYYYVSWQLAIPEMAGSLNMPFENAYEAARQMFEKKKGK